MVTAVPPSLTVERGSSLLAFVRDKLGTLDRMAALGEPVVQANLGPIRQWFVFDADLVRVVLQSEADTYVRPTAVNKLFMTVSGTNLFTAAGDEWAWRRRAFQPAFQRDAMAGFSPRIDHVTSQAVAALDAGPVADLQDVIAGLVLRIAASAMFGVDLSDDADAAVVRHAFDGLVEWTNARLASPVGPPAFLPTGRNRRMKAGRAALFSVLSDALVARRAEPRADGVDVLDQLLGAEHPAGGVLTDADLLNEALVLLFAGYETTAAAAAWCVAHLTDRPDLQLAIAAAPDDDHDLLDRVIDETMRLHPPAWGTARMAARQTTLGGYPVKRGTGVIVATYAVHRHAGYWSDPLRFDPDRFLPTATRTRPPGAFHPFSVGPRHCLGMRLARLELQLIVRTLCRRFEITRPAGAPAPAMDPVFALRIEDALPVVLTAR